jgi:hypothetical protein
MMTTMNLPGHPRSLQDISTNLSLPKSVRKLFSFFFFGRFSLFLNQPKMLV